MQYIDWWNQSLCFPLVSNWIFSVVIAINKTRHQCFEDQSPSISLFGLVDWVGCFFFQLLRSSLLASGAYQRFWRCYYLSIWLLSVAQSLPLIVSSSYDENLIIFLEPCLTFLLLFILFCMRATRKFLDWCVLLCWGSIKFENCLHLLAIGIISGL